ncbi:MAG: MFS transporter [Bryobacteraceae bacterium]
MIANRWVVLGVFVLSSTLNYLDRQALATLAPMLLEEFRLSNTDYGVVVAAFSITYAAAAPLAGLLIDRIGLTRGISLAVGLWSAAGICTGFVRGLGDLLAFRMVLGLGEAGGIPAAGKAISIYLKPGERALGHSLNQAAVSLGLILAPPLATWLAISYGWRSAFVATGLMGLIWIPLWWRVRRVVPIAEERIEESHRLAGPLRARRLAALAFANGLSMVIYSLWTNWPVLFLVDRYRLTLVEAAWLVWIPPVFLAAGGMAGGWLSFRAMQAGVPAVRARTAACLAASGLALITAAVPFLPNAGWAAAAICVSVFSVGAFSVNMYSMPIDEFPARAAFAVSVLVSGYGLMQTVVSPGIGYLIDGYGYQPVCALAALTPAAACGVLRWSERF